MPVLVPPVLFPGALSGRGQPVFRTGELTVRPWQLSDAEALLAAYLDADIQRWHVRTMIGDEASSWIESRTERWQAETGADWAVSDPSGLVGRVGLRAVSLEEGRAEVAYWVVPAARGHEIASRSLASMTQWLFNDVGSTGWTYCTPCITRHRAVSRTKHTSNSKAHSDSTYVISTVGTICISTHGSPKI